MKTEIQSTKFPSTQMQKLRSFQDVKEQDYVERLQGIPGHEDEDECTYSAFGDISLSNPCWVPGLPTELTPEKKTNNDSSHPFVLDALTLPDVNFADLIESLKLSRLAASNLLQGPGSSTNTSSNELLSPQAFRAISEESLDSTCKGFSAHANDMGSSSPVRPLMKPEAKPGSKHRPLMSVVVKKHTREYLSRGRARIARFKPGSCSDENK